MLGFRLSAETPPEAKRVNDIVLTRFEHIYEIDPSLMSEHVQQQQIPNWDIRRIVDSRWEHLRWMQDHFAEKAISGEELLAEIERET
jgi:hypothetical protein